MPIKHVLKESVLNSIEPSKTRIGELGAWAKKDFRRNSVFGPYKGVNLYKVYLEKCSPFVNGGNACKVSSVEFLISFHLFVYLPDLKEIVRYIIHQGKQLHCPAKFYS